MVSGSIIYEAINVLRFGIGWIDNSSRRNLWYVWAQVVGDWRQVREVCMGRCYYYVQKCSNHNILSGLFAHIIFAELNLNIFP